MSKIPVHQWTHDGKEVLLVKCVGADGKSYGGFQWPQSGQVETAASRKAAATGERSSAAATLCAFAGLEGRVRGKIGGALILAFEKKDKSVVAKATIIDGKKIKAGVWYSLNKQGSFVASKDQSKIFGEKDEEQKP